MGEVLAGEGGAAQVGVGGHPEPGEDLDRVGAGDLVGCPRRRPVSSPSSSGPARTLSAHVLAGPVVGEVAEELDGQLAERAACQQLVLAAGEPGRCLAGHQPLHDGAWMNRNRPSSVRTSRLPEPMAWAVCRARA